MRPGSGAYNIACIECLRGSPDEARQWLEKSHQLGTLPDHEHLMEDPDLEGVREKTWFKDLLAKAKRASGAPLITPSV